MQNSAAFSRNAGRAGRPSRSARGATDEAIHVFRARRRPSAAPRPLVRARRHRRGRRPRQRRAPSTPARAASTRQVAPVVELYTSEGCNSCPPADRWLSKLKADPAVVALAFHVDYWDRLGWKDRFASAAFTAAPGDAAGEQRRALQLHAAGRRRRPRSHRLVARHGCRAGSPRGAGRGRARARDGDRFVATVTPAAGAPQRLAAYWAVTEQGHVTAGQGGRERRRDAAPRLRRARLRAGGGLDGARRRTRQTLQLQAGDAAPMRRTRAASTWSSSTPRPAGRCRR